LGGFERFCNPFREACYPLAGFSLKLTFEAY
jgi:hypothetical protein